ncbi:MAG: substrate-binding periplasmic protein [Alishewanella aestuarii]
MISGLIISIMLLLNTPVPAEPQRMQVLVGLHKPPYVDLNTGAGYELDLLREIFVAAGWQAEFTHVPNGRLMPMFKSGTFDAVTLQPMSATEPDYFYSCPYIQYQNVVARLATGRGELQSLAELAQQRVIAFQTAQQVLGEEFRRVIPQMASYSETVDQSSQVDMLLRQRADAIVLDLNILGHHLDALAVEPALQIMTFQSSYYRVAFRDAAQAAAFDRAQRELWRQATFIALQQRYFRQANQQLAAFCP